MPIYIHDDQKVTALFWHSLHLWSSYPPARLQKCYCNRGDSWTEPSMAQEVCILNGVSMRFGEAWPFSDSLNVRYFPLRVKRKDAFAVFLPSMGALLNGRSERKEGDCSSSTFLIKCRSKLQSSLTVVHFSTLASEQKSSHHGNCIRDSMCMNNWHRSGFGKCSNVLEPLNIRAFISVLCASIFSFLFCDFLLQLSLFCFMISVVGDMIIWSKIRQTLKDYCLIKHIHQTLLLLTLSNG